MAEEMSYFLGSPAKFPDIHGDFGILTHHVSKIVWKVEDPRLQEFLYWTMRGKEFQIHCRNFGTGTTVYAVKNNDVLRFLVPSHPSEEQQQIVACLEKLNLFEESLKRMVENLESQINAIFQSWLIDFSPVKDKANGKSPNGISKEIMKLFPDSFEETEIGKIPSGWTIATIHDLAKLRKDIVKQDEFSDKLAYIGLEHIPRNSLCLTNWGHSQDLGSNKYRFSNKDILFGKLRPYFHKVGLAPVEGVCSTDILVIQPKNEKLRGFLLPILFSEHFVHFVSGCVEGDTLPRTKWDHFKLYKIAMPPIEIQEIFSSKIDLILQNIESAIHTLDHINRLRDALLSQLTTTTQ